MKEKLKNKGFWVSLISAIIVFVQAIGIKIDVPAVNEVVSAVLTLLVVLGIVSNPSSGSGYADGDLFDRESGGKRDDGSDSSDTNRSQEK